MDEHADNDSSSSLCRLCRGIGTDHSKWYLLRGSFDPSTLRFNFGVGQDRTWEVHVYLHHRSTRALRAEAARGCPLCRLLAEKLANQHEGTPVEEDGAATSSDAVRLDDDEPSRLKERVLDTEDSPDVAVAKLCGAGQVVLKGGIGRADEVPFSIEAFVVRPGSSFRDNLKLGLHTQFGDPLAKFGSQMACAPRLLDDDLVERIEYWQYKCLTTHKKCQQMATDILQPLPTRVLDLSPLGTTTAVQLVTGDGKQGIYACLSYSWGAEPPKITTTSANLAHHLATPLPDTALSRIIHDAVILCRRLRIPYLWVDALCITQDDPADWAREKSRLPTTIGRAYLTLTSPQTASPSQGFLDRAPQQHHLTLPWTLGSVTGHVVVKTRGSGASADGPDAVLSAARSPWMTRGWALPEWLLSRRVLHCGSDMVIWDCNERWPSVETERYADDEDEKQSFDILSLWHRVPAPQPTTADQEPMQDPFHRLSKMHGYSSHVNEKHPFSYWRDLITDYTTTRTLTHAPDKLPALAGLVHHLQHHPDGTRLDARYLAGLWHFSLAPPSLAGYATGRPPYPSSPTPDQAWAAADAANRGYATGCQSAEVPFALLWHRASPTPLLLPTAGWRAPSWSWAARDGPVGWYGGGEVKKEFRWVATCREAHCEYDDMGAVAPGAWLDVESYLCPAIVSKADEEASVSGWVVLDADLLDLAGREEATMEAYAETMVGVRTGQDDDWVAVLDGGDAVAADEEVFLLRVRTRTFVSVQADGYARMHEALVLRRRSEGVYERLGVAWYSVPQVDAPEVVCRGDGVDFEGEWTYTTVRLV